MDKKPAIEGGKPVRDVFLPYNRIAIDEEEISEVEKVLRSGWLTMGPKVQEFEQLFSQYIGVKNAVAINSCTAGLHLSLVAAQIGQGDEVIVPTYTFASTANTVVWTGAKPVLVDIEKGGFNISIEAIKKAITDKTKAIIPVHYGGMPCDMTQILEIVKQFNLKIIEDSAHTIGVKYKDKNIGTIGDATAFSFYATKNLTTGEGGMVTTEDKEIADKIRTLRLHGMTKDAWKRYDQKGSWYYEISLPGFKCNMTDIQAAMGIVQLGKLDKLNKKRRDLAQYLSSKLNKIEGIILPKEKSDRGHCWHLYPIRIDLEKFTITRDQFINALNHENIGTSVHFIPLHRHPFYNIKYSLKSFEFPNAEEIYHQEISLPLYPLMTTSDADDVVLAVEKIASYYRKN
jgi:dTDP-4-amino-4,6-dideoxygalactose transaminase